MSSVGKLVQYLEKMSSSILLVGLARVNIFQLMSTEESSPILTCLMDWGHGSENWNGGGGTMMFCPWIWPTLEVVLPLPPSWVPASLFLSSSPATLFCLDSCRLVVLLGKLFSFSLSSWLGFWKQNLKLEKLEIIISPPGHLGDPVCMSSVMATLAQVDVLCWITRWQHPMKEQYSLYTWGNNFDFEFLIFNQA